MKNWTKMLVVTVAIIAMAGSFSACSWFKKSEGPKEFSADLTSKDPGGTFTGKVYATKDKLRMDIEDSTVIARFDNKVVWVLVPQIKQYLEQALEKVEHPFAGTGQIPGETKRELVGTEDIGGRKAEKYKVTINKNGKDEVVLQWLDADMKVPLKTSAEDSSWSLEYSNVKIGSQPSDIFELPQGYSKLALPIKSEGVTEELPGDSGKTIPGDVSPPTE